MVAISKVVIHWRYGTPLAPLCINMIPGILLLTIHAAAFSLPDGFTMNHGCSSICFSPVTRSEEHTSELQSHRYISDAVFCLRSVKAESAAQFVRGFSTGRREARRPARW